jgi:uncharacterized protein
MLMSKENISPERAMGALFEGLGRRERMALLGRLEIAGGTIYRALAAEEKNVKARAALLKAAEDEERNGALLTGMTTAKTACEKCPRPLPNVNEGYACSFQCTFCDDCAKALSRVCPNCGGELTARAA